MEITAIPPSASGGPPPGAGRRTPEAVWRPTAEAVQRCDLARLEPPVLAPLVRLVAVTLGAGTRVEGAERLAAAPAPAIFALNHNNTLESVTAPVLLSLLTGRRVSFLIDWMYLEVPLSGALIRLTRPVPIYNKRARWGMWERRRRAGRAAQDGRGALAIAAERLAGGDSVGIFPEGTRNRRADRLLRGRPGLGRLVLASDAPVVPIGIHYPAAARLGRIPRIGRTVLRVGRPLHFHEQRSAFRRLAADLSNERWANERRAGERDLGAAIVERVMDRLSDLAHKAPARPGKTPAGRSRAHSRPIARPITRSIARPIHPLRKGARHETA